MRLTFEIPKSISMKSSIDDSLVLYKKFSALMSRWITPCDARESRRVGQLGIRGAESGGRVTDLVVDVDERFLT